MIDCYWYEEDKDMGATIPYCRLHKLYGRNAFDIHYANRVACEDYISRKDADEIIRQEVRDEK